MKLNRTGANWNRRERNDINENWDIIEEDYNNVIENISDDAFDKVVDSARINWGEPVDSFGDLPGSADEGETRMARDTGKVYRFDGDTWVEIQDIDPTAINEVDSRLNQKIDDNYEDVTTRLAETESKTDDVFNSKAIYQKEVFKQLPRIFPDYDLIIQNQGGYITPQGFTIDWENNEIFIYYSPFNFYDGKAFRWIVVYDINTTDYKYCFNVGYNTRGESIVYRKEGIKKHLYTIGRDGSISVYDITIPPQNMELVEPVYTIDLGVAENSLAYGNDVWLIGSNRGISGHNRRNMFNLYDNNFNGRGFVEFDVTDVGTFTSQEVNYTPKHQGVALGNNSIYLSMGGFSDKNSSVPFNYQGIKKFDMFGNLQQEGILDHIKMMGILEDNGINCDHIENEGIHIDPLGNVYTLNVHLNRDNTESTSKGILIFKEFSSSGNAIDFSSASVSYPKYSTIKLSQGSYPIKDRKMYHVLNGSELVDLNDVCNMITDLDIPQISFYSQNVDTLDFDGSELPARTFYNIRNVNGHTLKIESNSNKTVNNLNVSKDGVGGYNIINVGSTEILFNGNFDVVQGETLQLEGNVSNYDYLDIHYIYQSSRRVERVPVGTSSYNIFVTHLTTSLSNKAVYTIQFTLSNNTTQNKDLNITLTRSQVLFNSSGEPSGTKTDSVNAQIIRVVGSN